MAAAGDAEVESPGRRLWIVLLSLALLFMLLPAVNLVNLNVSRIMERASEIGVRKSFGASSLVLVGQFLVENLALTLIGGAIGLLLSVWLLWLVNGERADSLRRLADELPHLPRRPGVRGVLRHALRRVSRLAHVAPQSGAGAQGSLAMIRHVFKLIWHRKRTNLLLMVEIFFSFLVLFGVGALGVYMAENWRRPVGFTPDNLWIVSVDMRVTGDDTFTASQVETMQRVLLAARGAARGRGRRPAHCWRRTPWAARTGRYGRNGSASSSASMR